MCFASQRAQYSGEALSAEWKSTVSPLTSSSLVHHLIPFPFSHSPTVNHVTLQSVQTVHVVQGSK